MCSGKESKELFGFLKTFYICKRTSLKASSFYFVLRKGVERNIMATALKEKETFPISNIVIYLETNYYFPKDPSRSFGMLAFCRSYQRELLVMCSILLGGFIRIIFRNNHREI
ncbi:hypothetical protein ASG99_12095 [Bacillus sp. Soil768D1]|nr:hypothetical protein ASG99_12095 [Bacillus sp. Soil768D1]